MSTIRICDVKNCESINDNLFIINHEKGNFLTKHLGDIFNDSCEHICLHCINGMNETFDNLFIPIVCDCDDIITVNSKYINNPELLI